MVTEYAITLGLDVSKTTHHGCGLTPDRQKDYDHDLPQDEAALRNVFSSLQQHGAGLVIVEQLNTIGALRITATRELGADAP